MLYTSLVRTILRALHGKPPKAPDGDGAGLILVADGVGGLDLCGMGLQYAAAAERLPHEVRIVSWGHGFGRWHSDLTNVANRDAKAARIAAEVVAFRARKPGVPVFLVGKSGGT